MYKPVNDKTLQPNETVVQQGNSRLSYANALKQNINHKPPANNTTDRTSERPTLQQQLKSLSAKPTRRNRSRSPSRKQSTTKTKGSTKGSRNCKIESRN